MNILLWILQVLLALHTAFGGLWKFTNPPQTSVPTLALIPNPVWVTLGVFELLVAVAFILPAFKKSWNGLIVGAALFVVVEMLLYSVIHLASGHPLNGSVGYWLVVAAVSAFLARGRTRNPL